MVPPVSDELERLSEILDDLAAERDPAIRQDLTTEEIELVMTAAFLKAARPDSAQPRAEFIDNLAARLTEKPIDPPATTRPSRGVSRRGILSRVVAAAVAGVAVGAGGGVAAAYDRGKQDGANEEAKESYKAPMVPPDRGAWMNTHITLKSLKPGQAARFRVGAVEGFMVNPGNGKPVYAVSAICTHMGCALSWVEPSTTFLCPCHGAQYNADGTVLSGIARHPLAPLKVEQREDDSLWVWSVSEQPTTTTLAPYAKP
jgi:Rieske Fe-S protein